MLVYVNDYKCYTIKSLQMSGYRTSFQCLNYIVCNNDIFVYKMTNLLKRFTTFQNRNVFEIFKTVLNRNPGNQLTELVFCFLNSFTLGSLLLSLVRSNYCGK